MDGSKIIVEKLLSGETVSFRPRGNSMKPKIFSGQLCTVGPIKDPSDVSVGDVVLCKVRGKQYLHLVSAINKDKYQISNNHGFVNGWTNFKSIYGKLIKVED
jgi:hypothetical protein